MATISMSQFSVPKLNAGATGDTFIVEDLIYDHPSAETITKSGITVQAKNKHKVQIKGAPIHYQGTDIIFRGFDLEYKTTSQTVVAVNGARTYLLENKIHHQSPITTRQDWFVVKGAGSKLEGNDVYGKVGLGNPILIGTGSAVVKDTKILNNHLHDMKGGTGNGAEMIRVGSSEVSNVDFNCEIGGNLVENHDTSDTELFTIKTSNNDVHDNTFKNCKAAPTFRHGRNNKFRNNTLFGTGFRMYGEKHIVTGNHFIRNPLNQLRQIVIGNGEYKTEEEFQARPSGSSASYTQVRDLLFENNTIEMEDSTDQIILCLGYGSYSLKPQNNKIINNKIVAAKGTLANTRDGASWNGNTVSGNEMWAEGSAKYGDMPTTGYIKKDWRVVEPPKPEPAPVPELTLESLDARLTKVEQHLGLA